VYIARGKVDLEKKKKPAEPEGAHLSLLHGGQRQVRSERPTERIGRESIVECPYLFPNRLVHQPPGHKELIGENLPPGGESAGKSPFGGSVFRRFGRKDF